MLRRVSVIIENSTLTGLVSKRASWVCVTEESAGVRQAEVWFGFCWDEFGPMLHFTNTSPVFVIASRPQSLDATSPLGWLSKPS